MTSKEKISEELKLHRVKQNCHHLQKIVSSIINTMNPFVSTTEKGDHFNIGNGKTALGEMAKFLPNVWTTVFSACDCFIRECNEDRNACQNTIK